MLIIYRTKISLRAIVLGLILFFMHSGIQAGDKMVKVKSLEGKWKYSIGEHDNWVKADFNDKNWETIHVPSAWEDQGFHGYNGFGTYRKSINIPGSLKGSGLYLFLGYIDDVDETYLNGHKIGSTGSFPPDYRSAYNAKRVYIIPEEIINFDGENIIAVKVYDSYQYGGIVSGEIGIYLNPFEIPVSINLQGKWRFELGDKMERKDEKYDDSDWSEIFVPGKWEDQGYRNYDGYAWYRKTFYYKGNLEDEKLILMMGKIDDVDEVYVNGVKIGATGEFSYRENRKIETGDRYRATRGYYLASSLLKDNQWNTIAVRVYDSWGAGGIYEGPVGFLTQKDYIAYWRKRKNAVKHR